MTFFASLVLVFVLVVRPQEIWPALAALRLLDVFTGLVVLGFVVELATGRQKRLWTPQLPWIGAFVLTSYLVTSLALGAGRGLGLVTARVTIPAIFMIAVTYGVTTLPRFKTMVWLLLLLGAFVSAVAVHQGSLDPQCLEKLPDEQDEGALKPDLDTADGRVCGRPSDCRDDTRPNAEWACERLGLFKTMSTGRRVRWRGQLDDPNELSVFLGAVIPLLFGLGLPMRGGASDRSAARQLWLSTIALALLAVALYAVILSQSRGGQLVVATVFGIYFVSRFGVKGLFFAALLALPVLLLGGRSDAEADESSAERLELLYEGVSLFLQHPLRGVGVEQFPDQVSSPLHLTAHNSYLLAAAETGIFGFFLWSSVVWSSMKIPLTVLRMPDITAELRAMAMALVVSFVGIAVGIFFLSFTYKQLLFVWFGLAGAFYRIARERHESLLVRFGWRDALGVFSADALVLGLLFAYTRARGGGGG